MAGRPALFQLIDLRLDGRLVEILSDLLDRPDADIWFELKTKHQVDVSVSTVSRWVRDLRERSAAAAPS